MVVGERCGPSPGGWVSHGDVGVLPSRWRSGQVEVSEGWPTGRLVVADGDERWENLFKKRLLVHVDAVKEFYAKMTSDSLEEKGYCEVQAFGVPLVIKKGEEPKKYDFFEDTFLTMCKPTGEDGIWWIGSGENRRRDDDEATQEEEAEGDDEGNKDDFDREAIIDEATVEEESESDDQFYDAQVGEEEPMTKHQRHERSKLHLRLSEKNQELAGVDPTVLRARDR
ncbi:hypothetical protein Dimus_022652 [Dionaea muscipula]